MRQNYDDPIFVVGNRPYTFVYIQLYKIAELCSQEVLYYMYIFSFPDYNRCCHKYITINWESNRIILFFIQI